MENSGFTNISSMRAMLAKIIWRGIEARLAWRASPKRSFDDDTVDGCGVFDMNRIRKYVADGYAQLLDAEGYG